MNHNTYYRLMAWLVCLSVVLGANPSNSQAASSAPSSQIQDILVTAGEENPPQDWWTQIQKNLVQEEYFITWQETTYLPDLPAGYQAPNRANGLRTYFTPQGVSVIPRILPEGIENLPWRLDIHSFTWSTGESVYPIGPQNLMVADNRIDFQPDPDQPTREQVFSEWFLNDENGITHGYVIKESRQAISGGSLAINLEIGGNLSPSLANNGREIILSDSEGKAQIQYALLNARDAAGVELPAQLILVGVNLTIQLEASLALYPIQVELSLSGLPPDPDWALGLGQSGAQFGWSVATAGDTNGDGISDVIIGAPQYDGGLANEGRADVYLGWWTGVSITPVWTKESNQAEAHYGYSVATAGDVNGDGYADIIVGAPDWDDDQANEGGAWIYHGSATGPHSSFDNYDQGNQADARFGYSVASAGDVNKDGYSDVIVGAPYYNNGLADEGIAFLWLGSSSGISASHNWHAEGDQASAYLGISVSLAGDVDGDGFGDVIIGTSSYSNGHTDEGAALLWYGYSDGVNNGTDGTPSNANWKVESNQTGANMGISVSTAGDVNGDGYADVIVGAHLYDNGQTDEGRAWVYHGSSIGLNTTAANIDEGNQENAWFGFCVATAGDVNGDGYADVMVSAPLYTAGETEEGRVWVWHGGPTGISATNDWNTQGDDANAYYGNSVATAGDVNGDGYSDVIIGAPHALSPASVGIVYIFHGSSSSLEQQATWTREVDQALSLFGFAVSTAGDVNGDGYADVIIGSPYWDGGSAFEGKAWVYHGSANGLRTSPSWTKESNNENAQFGYAVDTAGDTNGDGYDEVIVGAPSFHSGLTDEGAAFVYPGATAGLSTTPCWSKDSDQAGAKFGMSVGSAGDINADGYMDIIVGAPYWDGDVEDEGGAWVYMGSSGGLISAPAWYSTNDQEDSEYGFSVGTAGDVNRDGFSDVIVGAPKWDNGQVNEGGAYLFLGGGYGLARKFSWRNDGDVALAQYGQAVGAAGDVNGDGFSDFIVGAPSYANGQEGEGKVFVYAGSPVPISLVPLWQKEANQISAHYGWSVGCAGDVNGDGYADIIVGAELWDGGEPGEMNEGGAWVYHGSSTGPHSAPDWYTQGNQASAHYGASVGTAGDVNGDGYAEVIVGAPLYNNTYADAGKAYVYYGNGGRGVSLRPRLINYDDSPLAYLGKPNDPYASTFQILTYTPFGRGLVTFEIEYKFLGKGFTGSDTIERSYYRNDPMGYVNEINLASFHRGVPHHWRMRLIYHTATTPFMPASRWVTNPWNGWQEKDFLSGGSRIWIPLMLK